MSEPVIKAKAWMCPRCDSTRPASMGPHGICVHPAPRGRDYVEAVDVDVALYTHDDLVRVALATFEWAGFKVDPEGAEGKAAAVIVDRLTKGET